jgi:hypothetical protein
VAGPAVEGVPLPRRGADHGWWGAVTPRDRGESGPAEESRAGPDGRRVARSESSPRAPRAP